MAPSATPAPAPAPPAPRSFLRRHGLKLAASALITSGLIWTVEKGGLKLVPEGGDFGAVHPWAVIAYFPLLAAMMWFRSVRWRFLLGPLVRVPPRTLFAISSVGFAAILIMPFRIGELVRPYLLAAREQDRRPGPSLSLAAAASSIVAERVIDGLFLSVVLALVLLLVPTVSPLPERVVGLPISAAAVRESGFVMLAVFSAAFAAIAVFYFARGFARRATEAIFGRISPALARFLGGTAERLADGLHVFRGGRQLVGFLLETSIYWAFNALGMWVLAVGCGVVHADGSRLTFPEACGLMGMLGCAILIPGPPGLLGVFQVGIYAALTLYCPPRVVIGAGAAYVFLLYLSQVVFIVGTGAWGLWAEGGQRRLRQTLGAPGLSEPA